MKLIVACVPKEYDLLKIEKLYPDSAIYVTTKTESEEKVREQMKKNPFIVYDSDFLSDVIEDQIKFAKELPTKELIDIKGLSNG